MHEIVITGATGFVGSALFKALLADADCSVTGVCRVLPEGCDTQSLVALGSLEEADFSQALQDVDVVIHTAARAHVMTDEAVDPLAEYRRVNVEGTANLARQAAQVGVKRFVFVSSIKVNGERTQKGRPFQPDDTPAPEDAYGISKLEAEQVLKDICADAGMQYVIVRPVLVYGPGVKANFLRMMSWVHRGVPLPLGAVHNKRSLVALDNLVDFLLQCARHPKAADEVFLVSDGVDLSTTELLQTIGAALDKRARLLPMPMGVLSGLLGLLGKGAIAQRLGDSLQVDISKNKQLLDWTPPYTVDEAMSKTARAFLEAQ